MTRHKKDKWLKVFCPEESCLAEEDRISISTEEKTEDKSVWKETFCPEDACEIVTPTQAP